MKERIMEKAMDMFAKDGFARLNMDHLAKELGVSKKTLYEHFESKQDLFQAVVKEMFDSRVEKARIISKKMTKGGHFEFSTYVGELSDWIAEMAKNVTPQLESDIDKYAHNILPYCNEQESEMMKEWEKVFILGKKKGYIKQNINRNIFWLMLSTSIHHIMKPKVLINLPHSAEEVMKMIYEVLTTGVLTDKGREDYIEKNLK